LYCSTHIIRMVKLKILTDDMRRGGGVDVLRMGKSRHARLLWGNLKKRGHLEDKGVEVGRYC
jgi:hypothetical protein